MSTTLKSFEVAVVQAFNTAWTTAGYPSNSISFANSDFDPKGQAIWASFSIKYGMSLMNTMGKHAQGGANLIAGVAYTQIFVPQETGTGDLVAAADVVRDLFERARIGNGVFGTASANDIPGPNPEDTAWQMLVVSAPFSLEEFL